MQIRVYFPYEFNIFLLNLYYKLEELYKKIDDEIERLEKLEKEEEKK